MVVLKDDQHVFPPYQGAPLFKEKYLNDHPEVKNRSINWRIESQMKKCKK